LIGPSDLSSELSIDDDNRSSRMTYLVERLEPSCVEASGVGSTRAPNESGSVDALNMLRMILPERLEKRTLGTLPDPDLVSASLVELLLQVDRLPRITLPTSEESGLSFLLESLS
jgi:hypothetical protein